MFDFVVKLIGAIGTVVNTIVNVVRLVKTEKKK